MQNLRDEKENKRSSLFGTKDFSQLFPIVYGYEKEIAALEKVIETLAKESEE